MNGWIGFDACAVRAGTLQLLYSSLYSYTAHSTATAEKDNGKRESRPGGAEELSSRWLCGMGAWGGWLGLGWGGWAWLGAGLGGVGVWGGKLGGVGDGGEGWVVAMMGAEGWVASVMEGEGFWQELSSSPSIHPR